jgi:hypothetical protein
MAISKTITVVLAVSLGQLAMQTHARPEPATAFAVAKSYGFTDAEIEKIVQGDVLTKALKEGSDKELAGVGAMWLPTPPAEFADITLEGRTLKFEPSIRSLHVWKPGETAGEAFTDLQVDTAQQAILEGRYESYRKTGLKGAGSPGELLTLAIKETEMLSRFPGYAKALLEFPIDPLPQMEQRFFAYEQEVDKGRTFVLSHRSAVRGEHDALITEQRYYVSRVYECRFIATGCFELRGGTLVLYVTRLFTDQVAGVGSILKHAIGRRRMLADVAVKLKLAREHSAKAPMNPASAGLSMNHEL